MGSHVSSTRAVIALAVVITCGAAVTEDVRADGKVFSPPVQAAPTIPDQTALIRYGDGEQYLAIETRFVGEGSDFAWVVPLPHVPHTVEPVTTGLFPTLRTQFRPTLVDDVLPIGWLVLIIVLVIYATATRHGCAVLMVLFIFVFLWSMLLPSLGGAGGGLQVDGVTVHERRIVGAYETAVIESHDGGALLSWLSAHGFAVPGSVEPVVQQYADEGWVFVAAKLHQGDGAHVGERSLTPHPLGFGFATDRPVYPMRLTGVGNGELRVELYVLGDGRAAAEGFDVRHCTRVAYRDQPNRDFEWLHHAELVRIAAGASVLTKLTGTLDETAMTRDVYLDIGPFAAHETVLYTREGALSLGLNIAAVAVAVGILPLMVSMRPRQPVLGINRVWLLAWVGVGLIAVGVTMLVVPKAGEVVRGRSLMMARVHHYDLADALDEIARSRRDGKWDAHQGRRPADPLDATPVPLSQLHQIMREIIAGEHRDHFDPTHINPYTGQPFSREDSPGNYDLKVSDDGYAVYVVYDAGGAAREDPLGVRAVDDTTAPPHDD